MHVIPRLTNRNLDKHGHRPSLQFELSHRLPRGRGLGIRTSRLLPFHRYRHIKYINSWPTALPGNTYPGRSSAGVLHALAQRLPRQQRTPRNQTLRGPRQPEFPGNRKRIPPQSPAQRCTQSPAHPPPHPGGAGGGLADLIMQQEILQHPFEAGECATLQPGQVVAPQVDRGPLLQGLRLSHAHFY